MNEDWLPQFGDFDQLRLHVLAGERLAMQPAGFVVSNLADIARPPAPPLAGHGRGRHLASKSKLLRDYFGLGVESRESWQLNHRVRGV